MKPTDAPTSPRILLSCYADVSRQGENFVPQHSFSYLIAGSQEIYAGGKSFRFETGDFRFVRKNQLCRFAKYPPKNGEYKSVSILFDEQTLRSLSAENNLHMDAPYTSDGVIALEPSPLLNNFITSLTPYINGDSEINNIINHLKAKEAVMLLLQTNPQLKNILFDFTEPGKIDLEAFMTENYRYNVDISRFAYLTGRSLATFKRDFEKVFHTSPNRWLQQKRLQDAYYLIKQRGQKVSDVYMDVGFKDLSHFSYAFKKAYGVAPSNLI